MSARRKNSKALKGLHSRGLVIDGNFRVPLESAAQFGLDSAVTQEDQTRYITHDYAKNFIRIDPMLARRL